MPKDTSTSFLIVITTSGQNILILLIYEYYEVMVSYFSESEFTDGQFGVSLLTSSNMQTFQALKYLARVSTSHNNIAMSNGFLTD